MQTKSGDKSFLLFVCTCLCAPRQGFFSYFCLFVCFPRCRFFFFPTWPRIYLPISLSLFFLLFLPCLAPAPSHHQYSSVSYLPLSSPERRGNWRTQSGVHAHEQKHTHTHSRTGVLAQMHICAYKQKTEERSCEEMQEGAAAHSLDFGTLTYTQTY